MPQKLIIRKVDLPIVNLSLKCWHPCWRVQRSQKTLAGRGYIMGTICKDTISVQAQSSSGVVSITTNTKKKNPPVQLYSTWRSYKINGLFALILLLSFLKNEYHQRRSLRCLPCNPLVLDYILLAASLKSEENIGPSDDPDVAEGAEKKYSQ